jgi:transcriptional regulator with XRE-family HTH domain
MTASVRPQGETTTDVVRHMRALRGARGWTAQELADQTGIPRNVITNLETGRRETLSVDELVLLAQAFNVPPMRLIDGTYCRRCFGAPPDGFICGDCGTQ